MLNEYTYNFKTDPFDEIQSDLSYLNAKPACFVVFGPPGSGKSVVARIIAQYWKCLLLTPETVVADALRKSETNLELRKLFATDVGVSEFLTFDLLRSKLQSNETRHYGFILDDFPTPELNLLSLEEQFGFIRSLELKVDFIIILRFPLEDAVRREEKLYLHAPTGVRIPQSYIVEPANYEETSEKALTNVEPEEPKQKETAAIPTEGEEEGDSAEKTEGKVEESADDDAEDEATKDTKPAQKKTNKRDKEREALKAGHIKGQSGKSGQPVEVLDERLKTTLGNGTRTTFGHVRRRLPDSVEQVMPKTETPVEVSETTDEEKEEDEGEEGEEKPPKGEKPMEMEAETDVAFFRNLFFPNITLVDNKMHFPRESLHLCVENSAEWIQDDYLDYKKNTLVHIENFMAAYYPLRVIEIDGHTLLRQIPQMILSRLECMRLQPPPIPHPLTDMIALQKIPEETTEVDKQLEQALLVGAPSPRWKWRKSVFNTFCPVSLAEGLTVPGNILFATVFLDRVYLLADKEQQEKFIQNPRLFIMPPNPKTSTRFVVIGPSGSGRTTMASKIAEAFGNKIIDLLEISNQVKREQSEAFYSSTRGNATTEAITMVKVSLTERLTAAKNELETAGTELRNLKPDSPLFELLKDVLDPVKPAETLTDPNAPTNTVRLSGDGKRITLSSANQPSSIGAETPAGAEETGGTRRRRLSREESLPPINIPLPPIPQDRPKASLAEFPAEAVPVPPTEGLATIPEEPAPPPPTVEVAPVDTPAVPEIPPRIYTEDELARIAELEVKLPEQRTAYLTVKTDLDELKETTPVVIAEVDRALALVNFDAVKFDNTRFVALMKETLEAAHKSGTQTGNGTMNSAQYMLDNIPANDEIVAALLSFEEKLRPTDVVFLKDSSEKMDILHANFNRMEMLKETTSFALSDEAWEMQLANITQQLADIDKIQAAVTAASLKVHPVNFGEKPLDEVVAEMRRATQDSFKATVQEYVEPEGEDPESEEEEDEEGEDGNTKPKKIDENSEKTRPLGDTADYCPVALKESDSLRLGNSENGLVTYKDKIYSFSSTDAKEKFTKEPDAYLPKEYPAESPPLRIFVTGPTGSGRTTHAKIMADQCDAYLINLKTFMNEMALPKLQKPPVETFTLDRPTPYWRLPKEPLPGSEDLPVVEKKLPEGLLPVKLPFLPVDPTKPEETPALTPLEQACQDALTSDAALPTEVLTELFDKWTKQPPFARRNLVFDGFPQYAEDARFLVERGIFPDAVFITSLDEEAAVERVLPKRKAHWLQEKKKRADKRFQAFYLKHKEWDKNRNKKKDQLLSERADSKREKEKEAAKRRAEAKASGDEEAPEEEEEDDEDEALEAMEAQLNEEFPEPKMEDEQGEEESEDEETANDRLNDELRDRLDKDQGNTDGIREVFEEQKIKMFDINTSRPEKMSLRKWQAQLDLLLKKRESIFQLAYPVSGVMAKVMLDCHYKRLGKFGTWCPVKIRNGHLFPPAATKLIDLFPVIYRQHIYLCSTAEAREEFISRPEYFVRQQPPRLTLPVRLAVIGPPKSGKTTFAKRLAEEIGIQRISIGDAVRHVLTKLPDAELCRLLKTYLISGCDIPDTLEILCLEALLRTADCQARGWILDGYPSTFSKLNVMMQRLIVPTIVFELVASNKTCMLRSVIEIMLSKKQKLPQFNNSQVVATRLAHYKTNISPIQNYLRKYTKNLHQIDASASKWKMWFSALEIVAVRTIDIQGYVDKREKQTAAPLTGLCVTPNQMKARLSSAYGVYCPVTFNTEHQLFDCLARHNAQYIAEFKEKYYLFASKEKMEVFLENPDRWLPPLAYRAMPPRDQLPKIVKVEELDDQWAERLAFAGMCVVTYLDHDAKPSGLKYGQASFVVKYNEKLWQFCSAECMNKFLSQPWKYVDVPLPNKRPPQPEHSAQLGGPEAVVPYLETSLGPLLVQAIMEVAELRPKYPHIGYRESSMIFIGNFLKRSNPEASTECRDISTDKLQGYGELASLAERLILNAQGFEENPLQEHIQQLSEQVDKLRGVKEDVQKYWHALSPF